VLCCGALCAQPYLVLSLLCHAVLCAQPELCCAVLCCASCRDRPVPIPAPGIQLTTLSHVEDLADMLAAVPGNDAAVGQHFNICSDRCISFDGA